MSDCRHPDDALLVTLSKDGYDLLTQRCSACGMLLLSTRVPADEADAIRFAQRLARERRAYETKQRSRTGAA